MIVAGHPAISLQAPRGRQFKEIAIRAIFFLCAFLAVVVTALTVIIFALGSLPFFERVNLAEFFLGTRWAPIYQPPGYGALPLFAATMMVTLLALVVALPLGLASAVYLSEFATYRIRKIVKPILEILAGLPTVVHGYFALIFLTPLLQSFLPQVQFWNALSAGIVLGFAILPMISSISEDVIYAVPQALRDGAYALGATKWEAIRRVILPAAFSGISAAFVLAMSRAIGETMIVAIAAGRTTSWPPDLFKPVETITAAILSFATGDAEAGAFEWSIVFALGATLFLMTLVLNVLSHWMVQRFREKFE